LVDPRFLEPASADDLGIARKKKPSLASVVRNSKVETDSPLAIRASPKCYSHVPVAALPRIAGSIAGVPRNGHASAITHRAAVFPE